MKLYTTLNLIREHGPCESGWRKLLKHLGETHGNDDRIDFAAILESNGLDDALWALRAVLPEQEADRDRLARLFACDCVETALQYWEKEFPDDRRPHEAIAVSRRFAVGEATDEELAAARAAAWDAARDAAKVRFHRYFCEEGDPSAATVTDLAGAREDGR